jgi:hypothetical protein
MITCTLSINLPFTVNSQYFRYLYSIVVTKSVIGKSSLDFIIEEHTHQNKIYKS